MAVEIISWPNLYERYVAGPKDLTRALLNTSLTASHPMQCHRNKNHLIQGKEAKS